MSDRITTRRVLACWALANAAGAVTLGLIIALSSIAPFPRGLMSGLIAGTAFVVALVLSRPKKTA
jgi:hypothetical protein